MAPSHRERLLPAKGLPQDRNSLRQAGKKLSRFRLPHSRYHMVDLMSLGPSFENGLNWTLGIAWQGECGYEWLLGRETNKKIVPNVIQ